jgi:cell shape-determining protein MreD
VIVDRLPLALRLAAVGVLTVIFQATTVSQIGILGTRADLLPLAVAATGLLAGSIPGALMGFGVGLFADLALVQDIGVSSLLLVPVGYGAGRLRELRDPHHALVPLAAGAAATLVTASGVSLIQIMLGVDAPMSWLLLREIIAVTLVNALVALPFYALLRRVLGASLPDGGRRRRRRAYTTGGLSPLSSSARPR